MIEIEYDAGRYCLSVRGHAGAGKKGRDVVCAGVSALVYTAAIRAGRAHNAQTDLDKEGCGFVRCYPTPDDEAACREMLETVMCGLRAIAARYGEHVTLKEDGPQRAQSAHAATGRGEG